MASLNSNMHTFSTCFRLTWTLLSNFLFYEKPCATLVSPHFALCHFAMALFATTTFAMTNAAMCQSPWSLLATAIFAMSHFHHDQSRHVTVHSTTSELTYVRSCLQSDKGRAQSSRMCLGKLKKHSNLVGRRLLRETSGAYIWWWELTYVQWWEPKTVANFLYIDLTNAKKIHALAKSLSSIMT